MALIGLPVFSLIMLLSERLFPFIFGDKWMLAGILSSIMTPWLFFNFLASSVSSVTFVLNKQKPAFYIAVTDLTLRLGVLYFFGHNTEFKKMIYYLTIISSLVMLFACWWYHLISSKYDERSVTA